MSISTYLIATITSSIGKVGFPVEYSYIDEIYAPDDVDVLKEYLTRRNKLKRDIDSNLPIKIFKQYPGKMHFCKSEIIALCEFQGAIPQNFLKDFLSEEEETSNIIRKKRCAYKSTNDDSKPMINVSSIVYLRSTNTASPIYNTRTYLIGIHIPFPGNPKKHFNNACLVEIDGDDDAAKTVYYESLKSFGLDIEPENVFILGVMCCPFALFYNADMLEKKIRESSHVVSFLDIKKYKKYHLITTNLSILEVNANEY